MRTFFCIIALSFLCNINIVAQKLSVESFFVKTSDITARTQPRQDLNGNDCALIKVQLAASGAEFDGNVVGNVSYNKSEYLVYMSEGSKRLSVKLEGYLPLEASFEDYGIKALEGKTTYVMTISGASVARQIEAPRIKTGWIILESEPSGASVYINNEFVGNTPLNNYKQSYGTYQYRLESPNYHPATGTIELNAGRFEQRIALKPAFGSISVKSNVAGAKILLDGKPTDKNSPATLTEIPSGSHTITLQSDKYAPQQQNVVVEDGQTANISMSLDARFARITINTLDGAEIYSNGKLLGRGHYSEDMMEGYYDLEVRMEHYKSVTKQIQVIAGQSQDITLNPIPKYGSLDVTSTPHDAEVTIDGKPYGKTPMTVDQLLEGEHKVVISKSGYADVIQMINIHENDNESLTMELQEKIIEIIYIKTGESLQSKLNAIKTPVRKLKIVGQNDFSDQDWEALRDLCNRGYFKSLDLLELSNMTDIPWGKFGGCTNLKSISIPNSVTVINRHAFKGCTGLTSISIPNSVTEIGPSAFEGCTGLTSINIPNSVTKIWSGAFSGCTGLTSISIPNSVTKIEGFAFSGCTGLTSITVDKDNKIYDSRGNCNAIIKTNTNDLVHGCKTTIIPNSVTTIWPHAFDRCTGLTSISIPNSVTKIGIYAFSGCTGLTSISIPNSVTTIEWHAFDRCTGLNAITIPSHTKVDETAFENCPKLEIIRK